MDLRKELETENDKGTYVSLKVINGEELINHYKRQGLVDTIAPHELHCTVAYSKKSFVHEPFIGTVTIKPGDIEAHLCKLGDGIVMKFTNTDILAVNKKCVDEGAISDYTTYIPHISISYGNTSLNLNTLVKPDFDILLGNETTSEINEFYNK